VTWIRIARVKLLLQEKEELPSIRCGLHDTPVQANVEPNERQAISNQCFPLWKIKECNEPQQTYPSLKKPNFYKQAYQLYRKCYYQN
jgi:hypothetical protein